MSARIIIALLWLVLIAAVWLAGASCAFLWLAGLWDSPLIPSWTRPWQWLVYLRHGDGSFSEDVYLITSAAVASTPIPACTRALMNRTRQPALYGKTGFADRGEMQRGGIRLTKVPFDEGT